MQIVLFVEKKKISRQILTPKPSQFNISTTAMTTAIKYSQDHQWVQLAPNQDSASVGITHHAQDVLGDVVFVDLPTLGSHFEQGAVVCVVESVKAAADVFMPISGTITEVNEALRANPDLANSDPQGTGWFFKIRPNNLKELDSLMDATSYSAFTSAS